LRSDEAAWIARALAGDDRAFAELMRCHHAPLQRLLRRILTNSEDAQDVLQETMLRAYRFLHRFDASRPFGPWLMRIGINLARNRLKQRARRQEISLDEPRGDEGDEPFVGEWMADDTTREGIEYERLLARTHRALDALPDEYRAVLELRLLAEMSYDEIAHALGIPIGTVMSRLSRGRKQIQSALAANGRTGR
jgi:RNA polymerase sigma-70 factor (ECF subfamily)